MPLNEVSVGFGSGPSSFEQEINKTLNRAIMKVGNVFIRRIDG